MSVHCLTMYYMGKSITFRTTDQEESILDEASKLLGAKGNSQVIHILLRKGYEALLQKDLSDSFEESGFIGCGSSGKKDIAGNHKNHLKESINKKWS